MISAVSDATQTQPVAPSTASSSQKPAQSQPQSATTDSVQLSAAAQAALAASEQGKFWPMFDLLYSHQDELIPSEVQYYATQEMPTLNINKFVSDTSSPTVVSRVDQQIKFVQSLKIGATPTFIVRKTSGGTPAWYVGTKDTPVSQGLNHFIAAPPWLKASG